MRARTPGMEQLRPHCLHFPGRRGRVFCPGSRSWKTGCWRWRTSFPPGGAGTGRAGRRFRRDGRLPVPVHGGKVLPCQGLDRAVRIAARLVEMGMKGLRWYLAGYGDEASCGGEIAAHGMEEHVVILGKKANPYPYMAACGLYVQPSRYEGKAVAVGRRRFWGVPWPSRVSTASGHLETAWTESIVPNDEEAPRRPCSPCCMIPPVWKAWRRHAARGTTATVMKS